MAGDVPDPAIAQRVGEALARLAARVAAMQAISPGAFGQSHLHLGGHVFEVTIRLAERAGNGGNSPLSRPPPLPPPD